MLRGAYRVSGKEVDTAIPAGLFWSDNADYHPESLVLAKAVDIPIDPLQGENRSKSHCQRFQLLQITQSIFCFVIDPFEALDLKRSGAILETFEGDNDIKLKIKNDPTVRITFDEVPEHKDPYSVFAVITNNSLITETYDVSISSSQMTMQGYLKKDVKFVSSTSMLPDRGMVKRRSLR